MTKHWTLRLALSLVVGAFLLNCGGGGGGTAPAGNPSTPPAIQSFVAEHGTVTSGQSVKLTATFTNGTGVIDHGVGSVTTGNAVAVTPTADTTYLLTVTGGPGASITASVTVRVVVPPGAPVITAPTTVNPGQTYTASTSAQAGLTYAWTISNGTIQGSPTGPSITFVAGASGTVSFTCISTDSQGVASAAGTASSQITASPIAPIITIPSRVYPGQTYTASTPAQAGLTYAWTISNGTIQGSPTGPSITFVAGSSGSISLSCAASDASGHILTGVATCPISAPPSTPAITVPLTVVAGQKYTASTTTQAGNTYLWTASNAAIQGDATGASITFIVSGGGTVRLTCVATDAFGVSSAPGDATCSVTTSISVPTITVASSMIAGQTYSASVVAKVGHSYLWAVTNATVQGSTSGSSISFVAGNTGTVGLTCIATASQESATGTATANIVAAPVSPFAVSGAMGTPRISATALLLQNGKVLVAGGMNSGSGVVRFGETFDSVSGVYSAASSSMKVGRQAHAAVLLPLGQVIHVGGMGTSSNSLASSELFNPSTGVFEPGPNMKVGRKLCTATMLPNGNVLVVGGQGAMSGDLASAEVYAPASGVFTATSGGLGIARSAHTATLLPNGMVLISGGLSAGTVLNKAELFDPESGTFVATAGDMIAARQGHTATLLPDGRVLLAGGSASTGVLASSEVFDPSTGRFSAVPMAMTSSRTAHQATLLPNGRVLLTGGQDKNGAILASGETFDPVNGSFQAASGPMMMARAAHMAVLLPTGKVVLAGGFSTGGAQANGEVYTSDDPAPGFPCAFYPAVGVSCRVGQAVIPLAPMGQGGTSWSVKPGLPAGLAIDASTGAISGTPSAASGVKGYAVTATNGTNSTTTYVWIVVAP